MEASGSRANCCASLSLRGLGWDQEHPAPLLGFARTPPTRAWRPWRGRLFLAHLGTRVVPGHSARPAGPSSPVQEPDLLGAGKGRSQLVRFVDDRGFLELLPGEVPLLLATLGDSVAVDGGPQVGVDPDVGWGGSQRWRGSR